MARALKASDVLDRVRERIGEENLCNSCRSKGCRVYLEGIPGNRVLANADLAFPAHNFKGKRCDHLLFYFDDNQTNCLSVLIELKSGVVDASDVSEQLQQGANFVDCIEPKDSRTKCRPVLLYGG